MRNLIRRRFARLLIAATVLLPIGAVAINAIGSSTPAGATEYYYVESGPNNCGGSIYVVVDNLYDYPVANITTPAGGWDTCSSTTAIVGGTGWYSEQPGTSSATAVGPYGYEATYGSWQGCFNLIEGGQICGQVATYDAPYG